MAEQRSYRPGDNHPRRGTSDVASTHRDVSSTVSAGYAYSTPLPQTVIVPASATQPRTLSAADRDALDHDPVVIANRARLAHFHELRAPEPVDVNDALQGGFWFLFVLAGLGAAFNVFLALDLAWAAGAAVLAVLLTCAGFFAVIDRREKRMWQAAGHPFVAQPEFHWRLLTPGSLLTRGRAHVTDLRTGLASRNIDDSELEDDLDRRYRHGADNYDIRPTRPSNHRNRLGT
jgi:hypothetical protein